MGSGKWTCLWNSGNLSNTISSLSTLWKVACCIPRANTIEKNNAKCCIKKLIDKLKWNFKKSFNLKDRKRGKKNIRDKQKINDKPKFSHLTNYIDCNWIKDIVQVNKNVMGNSVHMSRTSWFMGFITEWNGWRPSLLGLHFPG